jgi:hypothetical protein
LQIDYTALSLVAPEKVQFRYKLEGHDRDWTNAGTRRQAFYNDLAPRHYRFRVMASNNSGVWNETGDSLEFSIAPASVKNLRVNPLGGRAGHHGLPGCNERTQLAGGKGAHCRAVGFLRLVRGNVEAVFAGGSEPH